MQLNCGGRSLNRHRSFEGITDRTGLVFAKGDEKDLLRLQDGSDSLGNRQARDVIDRVEEPSIVTSRLLTERNNA